MAQVFEYLGKILALPTTWIFFTTLAFPVLLTWIASTILFRTQSNPTGENNVPPTLPYFDPILGHAISLGLNPSRFLSKVLESYGWETPLKLHAGFLPLIVVSNPAHIQTVWRSSKHLTSQASVLFALKYMLGTPANILPFYARDDSGNASKPRKGSTVPEADRIGFHQAHSARRFLSSHHLIYISERYLNTLEGNMQALRVGAADDWVEYPDLFRFLQIHVARASIETLMGSKILELNPTLVDDFWEFDKNVPNFLRCLPRWLMPSAYRARDRVLEAVKAWHALANAHSDCSSIEADDVEWEPYFGSKLLRARQNYGLKASFMTDASRASEDLGFMMASNSNSVRCIFWYVYEALRDTQLQRRMLCEVSSCVTASRLDISKLSTQPLLQSAYAEILRLRIATAATRLNESDNLQLGDYSIPKGETLIIFSRAPAMNAEAWASSGRPPAQTAPLEDFHAARFLVPKEPTEETLDSAAAQSPEKTEFSMEGTAGCWLPYGGGERMCPGRHFAKNEIIGTFASLFTQFDLELTTPGSARVDEDLGYFPTGGLPPVSKVPFRIRKKKSASM